jgi:uncharacterized protein
MRIYEFVWPQERIDHVAEHGVEPHEFEEVCAGKSLVRRVKSAGANPVYNIMGRTKAGRYLFCVVIRFPDGRGYVR